MAFAKPFSVDYMGPGALGMAPIEIFVVNHIVAAQNTCTFRQRRAPTFMSMTRRRCQRHQC